MRAYTGIISKEEFVNELKKHQAADNFIKVEYWNGEKGCAVGCSLESVSRLKKINVDFYDHKRYEDLLGIPKWLARLEDKIYEKLPDERSKKWPVEFGEAINTGAELERIKGPFLICVLNRTLTTFDNQEFPDVTNVINTVINLWKNGGSLEDFNTTMVTVKAVRAARAVAGAAAGAPARAARAAGAAGAAAVVAEWASDAAEWAAEAAIAWVTVIKAVRAELEKIWEYFADELLKMIKNTKPQEEPCLPNDKEWK